MAYTPTAWNAVDFNGSGIVVSTPAWNEVDFITPPATLLRGHVVASADVSGSITHQVFIASAISAQPTVVGVITHQVILPASIVAQPDVFGEMWKTHTISGAVIAQPVVSGSLARVHALSGAIISSPVVSGRLDFVNVLSGEVTASPVVSGLMYRPGYEIFGNVTAAPSVVGSLAPGRAIFGAVVACPTVSGAAFRRFRASLDISIKPVVSGVATHSPGINPARVSGRVVARPVVEGTISA